MKIKTRNFLFVTTGTALLDTGIGTALVQTPRENDSDLPSADIEALADDEEEAGYVNSKSTNETYGDYYDAGGGISCRSHVIETICRGSGPMWCTHTVNVSQECK